MNKTIQRLIESLFDDDIFNDNNDVLKELNVSKHIHKQYKFFPDTLDELKDIIRKCIKERGYKCDLNDIDVSKITDMTNLFFKSRFNGNISEWDVSNVTNMCNMFYKSAFTGNISEWDVSNIKNMQRMFVHTLFNGDISEWDVSNVTNMRNMFSYSSFNLNINLWDVSNVHDFVGMFYNANFKKDISNWEFNKEYVFTEKMFHNCQIPLEFKPKLLLAKVNESLFDDDIFNDNNDVLNELNVNEHMYSCLPKDKHELQDIIKKRILEEGNECDLNDINVSKITDMSNLFYNMNNFNGDISLWNVSNVSFFNNIFYGCSSFNNDISNWEINKTSSVDMSNMFRFCKNFNLPIGKWNISNVTDMHYMLAHCINFKLDLSNWDLTDCKKDIDNIITYDVPIYNQEYMPKIITIADIALLIFKNKNKLKNAEVIKFDDAFEYGDSDDSGYFPVLNSIILEKGFYELNNMSDEQFIETINYDPSSFIYADGIDAETNKLSDFIDLSILSFTDITYLYYEIKKYIDNL